MLTRYRILAISTALLALVAALAPLPPARRPAQAQPTQQTRLFLPFLSSPGGEGGPATADPATSEELIDRAVSARKLDEETALVYRVFAAYGDPRLPAAYRGDDDGLAAPFATELLNERFAALKPATQALLAPFRKLPTEAGSWYEARAGAGLEADAAPAQAGAETEAGAAPAQAARIQWKTVGEAGDPYKVWYQTRFPDDEARARVVYAELKRLIWPKLTGLMDRPLPDDGLANNGGDGRFDIYLVNTNQVVGYRRDSCAPTPAYMLVNRNNIRVSYVAVMLMDAILRSYPVQSCSDYRWLRLATSFWAGHYTYPDAQIEHRWARRFLARPDISLEGAHPCADPDCLLAPVEPLRSQTPAAYLFPFYMQHTLGDPGLIRQAWERAAGADSLSALNQALPNGLAAEWPRFVLSNWNQGPIDDYQGYDRLRERITPKKREALKLNGQPTRAVPMESNVQHLAAFYYHYTFADPNIRSVAFENPFYRDEENASAGLQALVKVGGRWREAKSWTGLERVTFCRDRADERIEELVLIISNSEWRDRQDVLEPKEPPRLVLTSIGCHRYEGTLTYSYNWSIPGDTGVHTTTAQLRLEALPPDGFGGAIKPLRFEPVQAQGAANLNRTISGCRHSTGLTAVKAASGAIEFAPFLIDGVDAFKIRGGLESNAPGTLTIVCPDVPVMQIPQNVGGQLFTSNDATGSTTLPLTPRLDGRIIGTLTLQLAGTGTVVYTWDLAPKPD